MKTAEITYSSFLVFFPVVGDDADDVDRDFFASVVGGGKCRQVSDHKFDSAVGGREGVGHKRAKVPVFHERHYQCCQRLCGYVQYLI